MLRSRLHAGAPPDEFEIVQQKVAESAAAGAHRESDPGQLPASAASQALEARRAIGDGEHRAEPADGFLHDAAVEAGGRSRLCSTQRLALDVRRPSDAGHPARHIRRRDASRLQLGIGSPANTTPKHRDRARRAERRSGRRRQATESIQEQSVGRTSMSYREVSEIRDGMRIDWDMPIKMDDGLVAALRHLPAGQAGQISGHPDLRPLRQVAALRRPLQGAMGADVRNPSRRADRLDQQVPVLGGGRSGEMGAGRLRRGARRQPRRRPLARHDRHLVAARGAGPGAMRRMGRRAALVERQGRA